MVKRNAPHSSTRIHYVSSPPARTHAHADPTAERTETCHQRAPSPRSTLHTHGCRLRFKLFVDRVECDIAPTQKARNQKPST
uniref:Uncharacterized protein n=1 Tax=Knipowitschia caucasica TaxID=637954 RepID=A0AAV2MGY7_KNICA